MVSIEKPNQKSKGATLPIVLISFTLIAGLLWVFEPDAHPVTASSFNKDVNGERTPQQGRKLPKLTVALEDDTSGGSSRRTTTSEKLVQCPYQRISDLTKEERQPIKGKRHMITPPKGGLLHLVCCETTKGPLNALVHEKWAPRGAKRFLDMVKSGYFNEGVPLMRCIKDFLCQFGLNNKPKLSTVYKETIPDDPNWLPEGPKNRKNKDGVPRFAVGYLAYAGGGKDTRDNQFIVSLDNVPTLAGGSPWEVPWGELVGKHSFETLGKFYTGYGEDGPQQGDVWDKGITDRVRKKFPELDYVTGCAVVDQEIQVA